jgi:hypothetical protein
VVHFPQVKEIYIISGESRLALQPTKPPVKWLQGALSLGVKQLGCELTTDLYLVPGLGMSAAIHPLCHMSSWHALG